MARQPEFKITSMHKLIRLMGLDIDEVDDFEEICTKCKYAHCDWFKVDNNLECPLRKRKLENKYRKLQRYVYDNLKRYGNTIVSQITYNTLGEDGILNDLKENGIDNVKITITSDNTILLKRRDMNAKSSCKSIRLD